MDDLHSTPSQRGASGRNSTAHHEAGHAVAAFYLDIKFKYVTIVIAGDTLGHIRNRRVQWAPNGVFVDGIKGTDRAERTIIQLFAGQLAERKLYPRGRWRLGGTRDTEMAMELFWRIAEEDEKARNMHLNLLWRRTEVLVESRWKAIQALAQELLIRKRMSHAEVSQTIDRTNGVTHRDGALPT